MIKSKTFELQDAAWDVLKTHVVAAIDNLKADLRQLLGTEPTPPA